MRWNESARRQGGCTTLLVVAGMIGSQGCAGYRSVPVDADLPSDAAEDAGVSEEDGGVAPVACEVPLAPVLSVIADSERLVFTKQGEGTIEIATLAPGDPSDAAAFVPGDQLALSAFAGPTRVLARVLGAGCAPPSLFDALYDVRPTYPPSPPALDTTAIPAASARIVGWADGIDAIVFGPGSTTPATRMPERALGPAQGTSTDVVSLGNGGHVTLTFEPPIADGDGADLAVFENGFDAGYLELAFVEVSSDGERFVRFDAASRFAGPPCGACSPPSTTIGGLASAYAQGYGTPFDLRALANHPLVRDGTVDLRAIGFVRIVDVVGDGSARDSFDRPIYDPISSANSAGFDLDAIAVLHEAGP